jgi:hypothetical protein
MTARNRCSGRSKEAMRAYVICAWASGSVGGTALLDDRDFTGWLEQWDWSIAIDVVATIYFSSWRDAVAAYERHMNAVARNGSEDGGR